jgi:replicative DNA helicase
MLGPPAMGSSSCARQNDAVGFAQRIVSAETRIDRADLLNEDVTVSSERLRSATRRLAALPLALVEADRLELWSIGWALGELAAGTVAVPRLVIIEDVDQLTSCDSDPSRLGECGRSLGELSRSLGVAIVVTTAAHVPEVGRSDRRPRRQDAAGWEQMAPYLRSAWLVYRDEMHDEESPDRGIGELILSWHSNGPTGTVRLAHLPHIGTWGNLRRGPGSPPRD